MRRLLKLIEKTILDETSLLFISKNDSNQNKKTKLTLKYHHLMLLSSPRSDLSLVEVKHLHRGTSIFNIIANKRCILLEGGAYFKYGNTCKYGTQSFASKDIHRRQQTTNNTIPLNIKKNKISTTQDISPACSRLDLRLYGILSKTIKIHKYT